jgi:peptidoglycan biosynthesis protein MviN/MurJ (putative lipid II flippase)
LAAASLAVFVIGLVAQSLVHLFVRGYYAAGNTKKPLIMNFAGELITIAFAFLFIFLFNHVYMFSQFFVHILRLDGVTNITLLALPLAFALGNIVNYFLLLRVFRVDFPEVHNYSIINTTIQTLIGSLVMGVVTYGILNILPSIIRQETFGGIFLQGLLAGSIGIIAFSIVMILLKNEEMLEFKKTMQRKFWKANIVIDQSAIDN